MKPTKFHTFEDAQIISHLFDDIYSVKYTYRNEEEFVRRIDLRPIQLTGYVPEFTYPLETVVDVWRYGCWWTGYISQILPSKTIPYRLPESKLYGCTRPNNMAYVVDLPWHEVNGAFSEVDIRLHTYV